MSDIDLLFGSVELIRAANEATRVVTDMLKARPAKNTPAAAASLGEFQRLARLELGTAEPT